MCLVWNETRNRRNGGGIGRRRKRLFGVIECSDVESGVLGKKIVLVVCTIYGSVRLGITMAINAHICTATIHTEWATYLTWLYYIHTHTVQWQTDAIQHLSCSQTIVLVDSSLLIATYRGTFSPFLLPIWPGFFTSIVVCFLHYYRTAKSTGMRHRQEILMLKAQIVWSFRWYYLSRYWNRAK